jgi:hypothetical protein
MGRVFGTMREEVARMKGNKRICVEELHALFSLTDLE